MSPLEIVNEEIVALHVFFTEWFNGTVDRDLLEPRFLSRLHKDVQFIPPEGMVMTADIIREGFSRGYGTTQISGAISAMSIFAISEEISCSQHTRNGKPGPSCRMRQTMPAGPLF
ncbi:hypothetical protein ACOTTU_21455 [Roseobacter sp. EG26]|uniref:hypothetical protein n=1 Tax=Roseobacter sp. EG26 TaxID=3412477 RepID=UPI003CE44E04